MYCHVPILYPTPHVQGQLEVVDYLNAHNVVLFRTRTNHQVSAIHRVKFHFVYAKMPRHNANHVSENLLSLLILKLFATQRYIA